MVRMYSYMIVVAGKNVINYYLQKSSKTDPQNDVYEILIKQR